MRYFSTGLFVIFVLINLDCKAQNAFYDALKLRTYTNNDGDLKSVNDTVYYILDNYIQPDVKNTIHELDSILRRGENPFLIISGSARSQTNDKKIGSFISGILPGGNATVIADGIGKFLAKRTKEELNVLFFNRFREFLNTHPEVAQLFPSTSILLNSVLNQEYPNLLSTLRASFDSDLKAMLRNMAAIPDIDANACEKCVERKKEDCKKRLAILKTLFASNQGTALIAGLLIADGAINKQNPADILSSIVGNNTIKTINTDLYNGLSLVRIFSESLRSNDISETWVSVNELNSLINDSVTLNIYLGLIYEQVKNTNITLGGQQITAFVQPQNVVALKGYINNLLTASKVLERSFVQFKTVEDDDSVGKKLANASRFIGAFRSFFEISLQYRTIHPDIPPLGQPVKRIFNYVDSSLSIVQKILVKEYYGAVLSATVMLENLLQTREDFKSNGEIRDTNNQDIVLTKKQFLRTFLRYGNFASNVVAAENSDDVEKAIETVALPPGSAVIKRTTNFNIAFQAYTGFVGGNIKGQEGTFNSVSVYAPVGVAFSFGLKPKYFSKLEKSNPEDKRTAGSLSIFGSILDVGAVVSYRFYHPDQKLSDTVSLAWSNIFAPGVNIVYGIPKLPLSIGFGAQYQATLRKFDAATTTVVEKSGLRYNFFLALDLPILNLYTSKR